MCEAVGEGLVFLLTATDGVWKSYSDEEAPLNTMVVTADLDDSKLGPDEVALASVAHVKLIESKKKL